MKEMLQNLVSGINQYLDKKISLEVVENKFTTPLINAMEAEENTKFHLPDDINTIVYALDMWDINNLSHDEITQMRDKLQAYIRSL